MRLSKKNLTLIIWIFLVLLIIFMPYIVSESRLKIIGKCLSLSIVALGIDLNWGFTGLLSLGQGIFFALGGYAIAMFLNLNSLSEGIPEFFGLYGVRELPFFWEPFKSPLFTLIAIWLIPGLVAGLLGYLVFRNRIKGVYFSILTQAALLVFYNFFNGQQKLINGTNGLSTPTTKLFGMMVGGTEMQTYFFYVTALILILSYLFCKWLVSKRFGSILIGIRDDEPRVRFSGYNPVLYKTIIFTIAGCLAGISEDEMNRVVEIWNGARMSFIGIDVANGYTIAVVDALKKLRAKVEKDLKAKGMTTRDSADDIKRKLRDL